MKNSRCNDFFLPQQQQKKSKVTRNKFNKRPVEIHEKKITKCHSKTLKKT